MQHKGICCFSGCMDYSHFSGKHPEVRSRLQREHVSPSLFYDNMVTKACVWQLCAEEELHCWQWLIWAAPWRLSPLSDACQWHSISCLHATNTPLTPLCVLPLYSLCVLSCLLFSPRIVSLLFTLTLLPSDSLFMSRCQRSFSLLLSFYCSLPPPPISSSPHLTSYPSFSFLFPVSWLDSIGVCALASQWTITLRGGDEGGNERVPFSIRTKHACGASRHQLEMQSGPLSWHPGWGRGLVRGNRGHCCVVGLQGECYHSHEIPGCFPGPSPSFKCRHLWEKAVPVACNEEG